MYFYRPQTKLRKGNVFTPVCQSFCSRGRVYPSMHLGRYPPRETSPARCMLGYTHTPAQCMLGYTHPTPAQCMLGYTHTPAQCMLGYTPLRTVRILLECILVEWYFCGKSSPLFRQSSFCPLIVKDSFIFGDAKEKLVFYFSRRNRK